MPVLSMVEGMRSGMESWGVSSKPPDSGLRPASRLQIYSVFSMDERLFIELQHFKPAGSCVVTQQLAALDVEIPAMQRKRALFDALAYPVKSHQIIQ